MASVPENIRVALANSLKNVPGVAQTSAWNLPEGFTAPCLFVLGNGAVSYDSTYGRGTDSLSFVVRGITGAVDSVGAQRLISQWVGGSGTSSVKAALQADRTLGGVVDDLRVTDYSGDQYAKINSVDYVYGDWSVDILISP